MDRKQHIRWYTDSAFIIKEALRLTKLDLKKSKRIPRFRQLDCLHSVKTNIQ
jgi:hypothetical protein